MANWISELRQRWRAFVGDGRPAVPFVVACPCGQRIQGFRTPCAQTIRCPNCRTPTFALGLSPLPVMGEDGIPLPPVAPRLNPWVLPISAIVGTIAFVTIGLTVLLIMLSSSPATTTQPTTPTVSAEDIRQRADRGQQLLERGSFLQANEQFNEANQLRLQSPNLLSPRETRQFQQQHRQADLLANLLTKSLEEVLFHAQGLGPEEWQKQFAREYKGRSVCFDDDIKREGANYQLRVYQVRSAGEMAHVDLNLDLLRKMDTRLPGRVLFGARLASVQRERDGGWVIRFDHTSGVLLTNEGAVRACGLPLDDAMKRLIRDQTEWVEQNP